ncbi:MAB_1171c family putative transporter [Nocardia sp. NPDC057440]|uniref:MAB_1171c family putative transporter n=1 Tax=Nocardia sp. NPDC057440 TaxID=3346134 RepID=UPI0036729EAD
MWVPVTGFVGWTVTGYVTAVLVGRLLFVRETIIDRLMNRTFLWSLAGLLLYRCTITPQIASLANQLALGCILLAMTNLHGIGKFADTGGDPSAVWRCQRFYSCVAVAATAVILLAGTSARNDGRLLDLGLDREGIAVGYAFGIPLTINTFVYFRAGVRELRRGDLSARETVLGHALGVGVLYMWLTETVSIAQASTGWPALGPQLPRIEAAATLCVGYYATLTAVPLVILLIARAGLDPAARSCRRLQPLWRDLTAAVPEIVLSSAADESTGADARLLRMTVEIRDALMHLGPYFSAESDATDFTRTSGSGSGWEPTQYAHRLADAVRARRSGLIAEHSGNSRRPPLSAQDFDTELRLLLDLARVWPGAHAVEGAGVQRRVGT